MNLRGNVAMSAAADLGLVALAGLLGLAGTTFLVAAAHGLLAAAIGPLASAAQLGAALLALAIAAWLLFRSRHGGGPVQVDLPPVQPAPPVESGTFAAFLAGFVLARRILAHK